MNSRLHFLHDGPAPARARGPLAATRWACGGGGGSSSTQTQSSDTNDSRVGVDGDGATVVKDSTLGNLTFNSLDAGVAQTALHTATDLGVAALDSAVSLAADSHRTAAGLGTAALGTAADLGRAAADLGGAAFDTAIGFAADSHRTAESLGTAALSTSADVASAGLATAEEVALAGLASAEAIGQAGLGHVEAYVAGQNDFTSKALDTLRSQGESALAAATSLADGSNRIAEATAKSQEQFVATASGQKTGTVVAVGALVIGGLALAFAKSK